jgi:hypothetical protein
MLIFFTNNNGFIRDGRGLPIAAFFQSHNMTSIGVVIRDGRGLPIAVLCKRFYCLQKPLQFVKRFS